MDARGECVEQGFARCGVGRLHLRLEIVEPVQHERTDDERRKDAGDLVADAHERDALRRAFDRTQDRNVRIRRGLQQRESRADDEEAGQRAGIPAPHDELAEDQRAGRHDHEADRHAFLHADAAQQPRSRKREEEIGKVEHHQHEERVDGVEREGELDELDQGPVEPRYEAEDEEEDADDEHRRTGVARGRRDGGGAGRHPAMIPLVRARRRCGVAIRMSAS